MTVSRPTASPIARNVCKNIAILSNEGGGLSLPSGAIGVWYADQYDSSRLGIPNAVATSQVMPTNLFNAPRRLFNQGSQWSNTNCTITDSNQTGPDGLTEASTVSWGSVDAYLQPLAFSYPAGNYTIAMEVATTDGSTVSFRMGKNGSESTVQATGSWATVSATFSHSGGALAMHLCRSLNSSTPASLKICNARLFAGSSDLGSESLYGHMLFGRGKYETTLPTYSGGVVTFNGSGKYGLIQFPDTKTLSAFTAIAVGQKKAAPSGSMQSFLSKLGSSYTDFCATYSNAGNAFSQFNNSNAVNEPIGLWDYETDKWHCHATRYSGSQISVFINGLKAKTGSQTGSVTVKDLWSHVVANTSIFSKYAMQSIVLYDRSLSDDEVRQARDFLVARASEKAGISSVGYSRWLTAEGDSITYGVGISLNQNYVRTFDVNSSPKVNGIVQATAGATIATLAARAATTDAVIPTNKNGVQFVLSVMVGTNDLPYGLGNSAYVSAVASYIAARKAAGWDKVVLCTLLPSTGVGFNAARNTFNSTITSAGWAASNNVDAICDFAADATIGPDAAASNATYYPDGTHPSAAAAAIMEPIYRATINGL